MAKGIVYCLTNQAMPGLVKIGCVGGDVDALNRRVGTLYASGVPSPFEVYYAVSVENSQDAESMLHDAFAECRYNPRREFFKVAPARVESAMRLMLTQGSEVDTAVVPEQDSEGKSITSAETEQAAHFDFSQYGIPNGAILEYRDDSNITAEVLASPNQINFRGRTTPSGAAGVVREERKEAVPVNGYKFWIYRDETLPEELQGETLYQRRVRMESEAANSEANE